MYYIFIHLLKKKTLINKVAGLGCDGASGHFGNKTAL